MTTGQLLFCGGLALLGLTVILGIAFLIKKPKYRPEAAYGAAGPGRAQPPLTGYPTDRVTIRRSAARPAAPARRETAPAPGVPTQPMTEGTPTAPQGTGRPR